MSTLTLAATSYPFSNRQLTCLASLASSSSTSTSSTSTIPLIPAGLIYLPPLLSLLPSTSIPKTKPTQEFDFNNPSVGFTTSHLPSIDSASIALHNALHHFRPVSEDYAFVEYANAFNWDELRLEIDVEREWYIVAFRSTRDLSSSTQDLYEADRAAHEEAVSAGGLLAYWFGVPQNGSNLATCIWMSRADAIRAASGDKHVKAMRLASKMYAKYDLERYVLKKRKGETGVTIQAWRGGEVEF